MTSVFSEEPEISPFGWLRIVNINHKVLLPAVLHRSKKKDERRLRSHDYDIRLLLPQVWRRP